MILEKLCKFQKNLHIQVQGWGFFEKEIILNLQFYLIILDTKVIHNILMLRQITAT